MWSHRRRSCSTLLLLALLGAPPVVHAQPGNVEVTVLLSGGNPAMGAQVQLLNATVGTAIAAVTNVWGKAAFVTQLSGPHQVVARIIGQCVTKRNIDVAGGGVTSVTLWLCADAVEATNAPSTPIIAWLDYRADSPSPLTCRQDELREGSGGFAVGDNAVPPADAWGTCHGGVGILSSGRALAYYPASTAFPWTTANGDLFGAVLPTSLLHVPVTIYINTAFALDDTNKIRSLHIGTAQLTFAYSFAGLRLSGDAIAGGEPPIMDIRTISNSDVGAGCENVGKIRASSAAIYDAMRLNIYYVDEVSGSAARAGWSCAAFDAPEIIFIDLDEGMPTTLAHEIGHSLGLDRPVWGHTSTLGGFVRNAATTQEFNIMASATASAPQYFSVGQSVRMTLGDASWLNRLWPTSGATARSVQAQAGTTPLVTPCACREFTSTDDCPGISLDVSRTTIGTFSQMQNTNNLSCSVAVVPAAVSVGCTVAASQFVDATFFGEANLPSSGNAQWYVLTPEIVKVSVQTPIPPAKSRARITGIANGSGIVRAFADGSFATVAVTVSGC